MVPAAPSAHRRHRATAAVLVQALLQLFLRELRAKQVYFYYYYYFLEKLGSCLSRSTGRCGCAGLGPGTASPNPGTGDVTGGHLCPFPAPGMAAATRGHGQEVTKSPLPPAHAAPGASPRGEEDEGLFSRLQASYFWTLSPPTPGADPGCELLKFFRPFVCLIEALFVFDHRH